MPNKLSNIQLLLILLHFFINLLECTIIHLGLPGNISIRMLLTGFVIETITITLELNLIIP